MALLPLLFLPTLVAMFVIYYVFSSIVAWYRLRHFSGPFIGSFSYYFIASTNRAGKCFETYTNINRTFGSLARIGPNDLITDDPELIRRMSSARSPYTRSEWYRGVRQDSYNDPMGTVLDVRAHDKLKAKTASAYSGKENPDLEAGIDAQLANVLNYIRQRYLSTNDESRPMDLARMTQYFTLDTITRLAYGKEFGHLATDSDVFDYIRTLRENAPALQMRSDIPWFAKIFMNPQVLSLVAPKPTDKKGMGTLMAKAQEVVSTRFQPGAKDQHDMLGAFIRRGLSQKECEVEVIFQIIAGSDSTATVLRATMLYIMTTPYVYQKLRDEIDAGINEGRISYQITTSEAKILPYLQAVIYEGIRIHPPFTGLLCKQAPPEGDTYNGKFIPGGTRIAHSTWSIMRNKTIFGEDVEIFRPERWLHTDDAQRTTMERTVDLAFGYGRWACAGKTVSFMELNKFYVELLRYFDFQLVSPTKPWQSINQGFFLQSDMWVKVTER